MFKFNLCILALVLAFPIHAVTNSKTLEKEVLESFRSLTDASQALDARSYFQHFDQDKFVGLNSDGTNWNSIDDLAPLINIAFDSIQEVISLEFLNVKVSIIDSYTAILVNEFSQSMLLKNGETINVSGGGTQVWSKRSGKWKLVSVSASNKP
ncbi:YybH family protein [Aliiglaciecola sp. M165]|uniref:YybH family protein n=1 Tax=Aliiglaciecola sp. M165 TaxID=2593649 RepID=UPI00163DDD44|nr:nuclear transport factor 2 family protein [Aliiglaciecola sp. M165]